MSSPSSAQIPILIPQPKFIEILDAPLDLQDSVRLETTGEIASEQAILSDILNTLGITVDDRSPFALRIVQDTRKVPKELPDTAQTEYYDLILHTREAVVTCGTAQGARWALHTFADLCRAHKKAPIPALTLRDWPDLPNRGIFVENKWGPDRMTLADWRTVIDRLAALKMNRMGVGIYGCWGNCHYENWPTEFLTVPVPGHPELKTEKNLRWYSPRDGQWHRVTYLPFLFDQDFLSDVVAYGKKHGVTVIPLVNSLGHNTMIPRVLPAVSAKNADGTPRGIGYCLSATETRTFIADFYGSIIDRYFPDGCDFFHIQLDEVWPDCADPNDPVKRVDPWCECPACAAREREENLQAYIVWLVEMLVDKGVKKVIMWNDQLTRHMSALDDSFVSKLKAAGLENRLILHWWWYNNETLNDKTRVSIGKQLGLPGWVAPMTCYYNWERYRTTFQNIELMLAMCREEGGEGTVSYSVHDPGWTDHEMLMASYAWHAEGVTDRETQRQRWAEARFGARANEFLEGLSLLQKAALGFPALNPCWFYPYSYSRPNAPWPRRYPEEALEKLGEMPNTDVAAQLTEAADTAARSIRVLKHLLEASDITADDRACITSLIGEAARVEGIARTFAFVFPAWQSEKAGRPTAAQGDRAKAVREDLIRTMGMLEANKPAYVVPASLQALSVLLAFLDQLIPTLDKIAAGHALSQPIAWTVAFSARA